MYMTGTNYYIGFQKVNKDCTYYYAKQQVQLGRNFNEANFIVRKKQTLKFNWPESAFNQGEIMHEETLSAIY